MKSTFKIIIFSVLGLFFSCKSNPNNDSYVCPSEIDLGEVMLIDSSLADFPYVEQDSKVIFKDSLSNEIIFNLEELSTRESAGSFFADCGSSQQIKYLYNLFYRYVELVNDSLDIKIQLIMTPEAHPFLYSPNQWNDVLILEVAKPIDSSNKKVFRLLINRRNNDPGPASVFFQPEFEEFISINNVEFEKVFWGTAETLNEELKIFYNRDQGIIGIQNLSSGLDLAFDRIE